MNILTTELEKRKIKRMSNEESNRMTKECLQTALIELMATKPFNKITITELVLQSGVSRTAFYRNYKTKEDVLNELSNEIIHTLALTISEFRAHCGDKSWYYGIFTSVQDNAEILLLLLQSNMPIRHIFDASSLIEIVNPPAARQEHYENLAFEGAFFKILLNWLENGMQDSINDITDYCVKLCNIKNQDIKKQ